MAENPEPLPPGPHVDLKTGNFTQAMKDWLERNIAQTVASSVTQIGGVISGQAELRAATATAQATAEAAQQQVTDVGAETLAFSVAVDPFAAIGVRSGSGAVTTNNITATPTGGTGPYNYAWSLVSGDTFTVNFPTSDTTDFNNTVALGEDKTAVYRVTVTDSLLATASATFSVSASEVS